MQYYVYLHASSTYTQGLSLKTHNLPTAVTLRCQITIIFPSTSKRRSLQLCGKPKRCLLSSFLFFFKEIFLWKCTARSYQQWCTSTDFANLDTQPPSFTNLKLNILFKCNPLKCFNAAKCHQVYGKSRESRQNFISMYILSFLLSSPDSGATGKAHQKKPRSCAHSVKQRKDRNGK